MILRGKQEENVDIRNLIGMSEKCTLLLVLNVNPISNFFIEK